jgi:TatA/E family protein of Tat protein translocase
VSGGELVLLVMIALLALGAHRLPEAGRTVGKGLRDFQRALNEARRAVSDEPDAPRAPAAPPRGRRLID